jgi:hypothetical protein
MDLLLSMTFDVWKTHRSSSALSKSSLVKANVGKTEALKLAKTHIQFPETTSIILKKAGSYNPSLIFKSESQIQSYEKTN